MADDARLREMIAASSVAPRGEHPADAEWERLAMGELLPDERARLADHVVDCATCAAMYRGLQELETGARAFDPGVPRKTADVLPFRPAAGWYVGLAAAAVLVLALLLPFRRPPADPTDDGVRSPAAVTPVAVAPVGDLEAAPDRFRWTPAPGAVRHHVELSRADGEPVWTSADVEGNEVLRSPDVTLAPGEYYWRVVAVPDPDRRLSAPLASPMVSFRLVSRP